MPVFSGPCEVASCSAATGRRSRCGSTCSSLASARALLSGMPLTAGARRAARWRPRPPPRRRAAAAGASRRHRAGSARRARAPRRPGSPARAAGRCRCGSCGSLTPSRSASSEPGQSRAGLQQRQQRQQPGGGVAHRSTNAAETRNETFLFVSTVALMTAGHSADTDHPPLRHRHPQADLDDLADRLAAPGCPRPAPGDDWDLRHAEPLPGRDGRAVAHEFDWRAQEARMNAVPALPHRDRRPDDPLPPRAVGRGGRDAAAAAAHLPGLVRRLPRHDRPADRPGRARRPGRGRVLGRRPVDAGRSGSARRWSTGAGRWPGSRARTTP